MGSKAQMSKQRKKKRGW